VLFHIKCPECGSGIVKTGTPTAAGANSGFDKAIADIKLLGATPDTEPSSSKEQVELFCLNGHKLALEEIGRQAATCSITRASNVFDETMRGAVAVAQFDLRGAAQAARLA
jgi:hypothetical protein